MTADGDDHDVDNDPLLRSMRSVWMDMEEDPPSRGLAELMAAARVKAVEMKPEPWWRRALASLVRPPMLAAATVVVLIGSTVVLTRRANIDTAHAPVTEAGERARPADPQKQAARAQDPAPAQSGDLFDGKDKGTVGAQVRPPVQRPRPAIVKPEPDKDNRPPPSPEPKPDETVKVPGGGLMVRGAEDGHGTKKHVETDHEEAPTADAVTVESTRPPAPNTATTGTDRPTVARPPTVSATQLLKQAETAAGRKDCPAVRATIKQIQRLDDKLYKERVVTQPAIKRCL